MRSGDNAAHSDQTPAATLQTKLAQQLNAGVAVQAQMQLGEALNQRPSVAVQRKLSSALSSRTVQRETMPDDDELMQGKFEPVQRQSGGDSLDQVDDEEPVQGQFALDQSDVVSDEDELLQAKRGPVQRQASSDDELVQAKPAPAQRQPQPNRTGLPDHLKSGMENLSGFAMDDVRVHYNSPQPKQLQALAFAQGSDIHVAPGQEQHLPHEAWHIVQQRQGRVQPTLQMENGVQVNDETALEREADQMGSRLSSERQPASVQLKNKVSSSSSPVQAKIAYPIATGVGPIKNESALLAFLESRYGSTTPVQMLDRYVQDLERQTIVYSDIGDVNHQVETRIRYDALGTEKWREFIDAKDHKAALAAAERGAIKHPGQYYDYRKLGPDDELTKTGDHYKAFLDADAFVSARLNTKMNAAEYLHIQALAAQGLSSSKQGLRKGDATWALPPGASKKQLDALKAKGLENLTPDLAKGGLTVHVPLPRDGLVKHIQKQFDTYYTTLDLSRDSISRLSTIITLYESLEAVHAFEDATSRTNHLVLNKLLTENGLNPAILNEPNSPTSDEDEFGRHVVEGIEQTRDIANIVPQTDRLGSIKTLAEHRKESDLDAEVARRFGTSASDPGRPTFVSRRDTLVEPFHADLDRLMGDGEREHIERLAPIPKKESEQDDAPRTSRVKKTLKREEERGARLILGNRRIDEHLRYGSSKQK